MRPINRRRCFSGFTLLEVLIAIAILAVSVVALFQAQTRSMRMARQARTLTVATQLARAKLYDCRSELLKRGLNASDFDKAGDFREEGLPENYTWQCHSYRLDIPMPSQEQIQEGIKAQQGGATGSGLDMGAGMGATMLAPFFSLIVPALKDSVQELVVIVKWKTGELQDELKVVTHVIDKEPIARLLAMIPKPPANLGGAK